MKITYETLEEAKQDWENYAKVIAHLAIIASERLMDYEAIKAQMDLIERERQACGREVDRLKAAAKAE